MLLVGAKQVGAVAAVFILTMLIYITLMDGVSRVDEDYLPHSMYKPTISTRKKVLVTGAAGFIGSHFAEALLRRGDDVVVVDELNDYYDVRLKRKNLSILKQIPKSGDRSVGKVEVHVFDICDKRRMESLFQRELDAGSPITHIVHLAARAGVRASISDPQVYVHSNVQGTLVMLDMARQYNVSNFVYASSSSVYGKNKKVPFAETDVVDHPVSPYAATKKATEMLCETYNHLYQIPMSGLRFFTVYGPRGRPDMAPFKFVDLISRGEAIDKYGDGSTSRDYTYISDIVSGIMAAVDRPFKKHQIFNLGNSRTVKLSAFISTVERVVGKRAIINQMPMQPGDVPRTYADLTKSKKLLGYDPQVSFEDGLTQLFQWHQSEFSSKRRTPIARGDEDDDDDDDQDVV